MLQTITNITGLLSSLLICYLITTSRQGASAPTGLQQPSWTPPGQSWFWSPGSSPGGPPMPATFDQTAARLRRQTSAAEVANPNKKKKSNSTTSKNKNKRRALAECLAAHNKWRRLHGVPELQWDDKLAAFAQKRSDHIAKSDGAEFGHPPDLVFGENLFWHSSLDKGCEFMVRGWYDEIELYDFKAPTFAPATGHFTQLVWRGTTRVGCAFAQSTGPRGGLYLTCNYDPPGNFVGEFNENVPRPGRAVVATPTVPSTTTTTTSTTTPTTTTTTTTSTTTTAKPEVASKAPAADDAGLIKPKKKKKSNKKKNKDKKKNKKIDEKEPKKKNKNKSKKKRTGKKKNMSTTTTTTTTSAPITMPGAL